MGANLEFVEYDINLAPSWLFEHVECLGSYTGTCKKIKN